LSWPVGFFAWPWFSSGISASWSRPRWWFMGLIYPIDYQLVASFMWLNHARKPGGYLLIDSTEDDG